MHRLIKQGTVPVEIRETTADGELALQWKVSHDSEYGQPGPLAYKTDTLVVNRGLELAGRPVPEILRLGSLREIAEATGTGEGDDEEGWPTIGQQGSGRSCLSVQYRLTREDFGPTTDYRGRIYRLTREDWDEEIGFSIGLTARLPLNLVGEELKAPTPGGGAS